MSFGSFFAALSGLQANASRLSVIGNNLANVNTIGFKTSRVTFHDFFAGSAFNGAGNPAQVGLGTNLASIDPIFAQGSLQTTDLLTDVAIQGRGFFVLADAGGGRSYTRAGNFSFDDNGNLVSSSGHFVQGYTQRDPNGQIIASGSLTDITIPTGLIAPPQATTTFNANINLNAQAAAEFSTTVTIYDSLGSRHDVQLRFTPTATPGTWDYEISVPGAEVATGTPGTPFVLGTGTVTFDPAGLLTVPAADVVIAIPAWANGAAAQSVTWTLYDPSGAGLLTGFDSSSTVSASNQNGHGAGELRSLLIDQNGLVSGIFANGVNLELARVALATFNNENGLLRNGQNTLVETNASGSATIGGPNSGGRGATVSGSLELSNVDITQEFTDLIISQRGYQANSRVITTSDEVIQESLNLKR
jgi:flagellar hook protein FlgE